MSADPVEDVEMTDAPQGDEQKAPDALACAFPFLLGLRSALILPRRRLKFRNYYPRDESLRKHRVAPLPDFAKEINEHFDELANSVDDDVRSFVPCSLSFDQFAFGLCFIFKISFISTQAASFLVVVDVGK